MMTIGGITGTGNNMQMESSGVNMQTDSVSKNIQNQIARAREQLQALSSNEDMSLEQKMKKRQEIQQEITALNQQLRQHQIEQRKEMQSKGSSMEDMHGSRRSDNTAKEGSKGTGLSKASMEAMISADSSMKQAKVQGSMSAQMEGKARVLESEIKMDKSRGADTEKKEEELSDLQVRARTTKEAQISTLADAGKVMEKAAEEEQAAETAESTEGRNDKTNKTEKTPESEEKSGEATESTEGGLNDKGAVQTKTQPVHYTSVDIRL